MNFVEELRWRGMIHDMMPGTEEQLQKEMTSAVGWKDILRTIAMLKQTTIRLISSLSPYIPRDGIHTFLENICLGSWNC